MNEKGIRFFKRGETVEIDTTYAPQLEFWSKKFSAGDFGIAQLSGLALADDGMTAGVPILISPRETKSDSIDLTDLIVDFSNAFELTVHLENPLKGPTIKCTAQVPGSDSGAIIRFEAFSKVADLRNSDCYHFEQWKTPHSEGPFYSLFAEEVDSRTLSQLTFSFSLGEPIDIAAYNRLRTGLLFIERENGQTPTD